MNRVVKVSPAGRCSSVSDSRSYVSLSRILHEGNYNSPTQDLAYDSTLPIGKSKRGGSPDISPNMDFTWPSTMATTYEFVPTGGMLTLTEVTKGSLQCN